MGDGKKFIDLQNRHWRFQDPEVYRLQIWGTSLFRIGADGKKFIDLQSRY